MSWLWALAALGALIGSFERALDWLITLMQ